MPPTNGPAMTPTMAAAFEKLTAAPRRADRSTGRDPGDAGAPDGRVADPLDRAGGDQQPERSGKAQAERPRGHRDSAGGHDPPRADPVGEVADRDRHRHDGQAERGEQPARLDLGEPELGAVVGEERDDRRPHREVDGDEQRDERDEAAQGRRILPTIGARPRPGARPHGVYRSGVQGTHLRMWLLLLLILAVLIFGVWGAVKVAFWVLLIALAVAIIAGFLGRGLFVRRSSL